MLQEFDLEIIGKRGTENLAGNHLFRLENPYLGELKEKDINDTFSEECLYKLESETPWFTNIAKLFGCQHPTQGTFILAKEEVLFDIKNYLWEDPYQFKICADQVIRRCIPQLKVWRVLEQCHTSPTGGHYQANRTTQKILELGFY